MIQGGDSISLQKMSSISIANFMSKGFQSGELKYDLNKAGGRSTCICLWILISKSKIKLKKEQFTVYNLIYKVGVDFL